MKVPRVARAVFGSLCLGAMLFVSALADVPRSTAAPPGITGANAGVHCVKYWYNSRKGGGNGNLCDGSFTWITGGCAGIVLETPSGGLYFNEPYNEPRVTLRRVSFARYLRLYETADGKCSYKTG